MVRGHFGASSNAAFMAARRRTRRIESLRLLASSQTQSILLIYTKTMSTKPSRRRRFLNHIPIPWQKKVGERKREHNGDSPTTASDPPTTDSQGTPASPHTGSAVQEDSKASSSDVAQDQDPPAVVSINDVQVGHAGVESAS